MVQSAALARPRHNCIFQLGKRRAIHVLTGKNRTVPVDFPRAHRVQNFFFEVVTYDLSVVPQNRVHQEGFKVFQEGLRVLSVSLQNIEDVVDGSVTGPAFNPKEVQTVAHSPTFSHACSFIAKCGENFGDVFQNGQCRSQGPYRFRSDASAL